MVSVTSGTIFSSAESKLTSFIGMTIFNNDLKFIIGVEDTFREMINAARNVSRDYNMTGRETVQGLLIDDCFDNHIKNRREKLLNGADIYGLHFQGDGTTIKDRHLLNILAGGSSPDCIRPKYCGLDRSYHRWSQEEFYIFAESFFDTMNYLYPDNKLVNLHMFYGSSVYRKAQKY